jgi:hypothetical protein
LANADGLCSPLHVQKSNNGYFLSAAFERTNVHLDRVFDEALGLANRNADLGNAKLQSEATRAGYTKDIPTIKGTDILSVLGIENPYTNTHNRLILQAGKSWGDATAFIRHSEPIGGSKDAKSATQIGLSYNF